MVDREKALEDVRIAISGAGASGIAVAEAVEQAARETGAGRQV
ncbi:MAG: hypothetical protein ABEJ66_01180 [Candidatus Nanohaloarchaea archaeon]